MQAMLTAAPRYAVRIAFCAALAGALGLPEKRADAAYAIAMHGAPAMPENFTAMPYVNPDAPKGGRLVEGVLGTFDSLNPLIVMGLPVQSIRGYVVESLMARGYDEPFTQCRDRRRPRLRHFQHRSGGAFFRRRAGDRRRRDVFLAAPA
jgi:ABC-type oligopeptide transport system substrate-binding subunit